MKRNDIIQKELTEISPVIAAISPVNLFTVPDGYFNSFPGECLTLIQLSPSFGQISNSQQTTPEGYFDNLANDILLKIKYSDSELPIFGKLNHPFKVSSEYFETLSSHLLQRVQPAKVVSMKRNFFRYAAAAVITGILGLSLFNLADNKDTSEPAILSYAQTTIVKDDAIDKALESIKDEEIVDYLSTRGQDVNTALVASTIDDNNLPSAEDYLLDENTLNEFLTENNIRHFN